MRTTSRTATYNLDGRGDKQYTAYDLPCIDPDDYWTNVTGIPCPVPQCEGTILWYEAAYVPGYRICSHCQRHFMARGDAEHPFLLDCKRKGCLPEDRKAFSIMKQVPPPVSINDFRVPLPQRATASTVPIPKPIEDRIHRLLQERNTCSDERVDEIDREVLYTLAPFTERVAPAWVLDPEREA